MKQTKRKKQTKRRKRGKRKVQVARTPTSLVKYKEMFLTQMARGMAVGTAARRSNIARCTVYKWRKEDEIFAGAWDEAIEAGVDEVESRCYERALEDSVADAHFILKYRRSQVYGDKSASSKQTLNLNISLGEHYKLLERLGLPVPVLEGDYEEIDIVDAPSPTENDT